MLSKVGGAAEAGEDATLGLAEMSHIVSMLGSAADGQMTATVLKDNLWLRVRLRGKGSGKFALRDPEMVATAVQGKGNDKKLLKAAPHKMEISAKAKDNFLWWMGITKNDSITVEIKKGKASLLGNPNDPAQLEVVFGKLAKPINLTCSVYANHLAAVLKAMDWGEEAPTQWMRFGMEDETTPSAIVLGQGDHLWAVMPASAV